MNACAMVYDCLTHQQVNELSPVQMIDLGVGTRGAEMGERGLAIQPSDTGRDDYIPDAP